jgi:hypothetical protein
MHVTLRWLVSLDNYLMDNSLLPEANILVSRKCPFYPGTDDHTKSENYVTEYKDSLDFK